jgi:hypothetical protein
LIGKPDYALLHLDGIHRLPALFAGCYNANSLAGKVRRGLNRAASRQQQR